MPALRWHGLRMVDAVSDIDRKIAERLGYHLVIGVEEERYRDCYYIADSSQHPVGGFYQSAEDAWLEAEREIFLWSQHIDKALALVEELRLPLELNYHTDTHEWTAFIQSMIPPVANTPAEAVAAAILAWLEAKEAP